MYTKTFQWSAIAILLTLALLMGATADAQGGACCKALTGKQLRAQWEENELNWRSLYRGKEVVVVGTVRDIEHSWTRGRKGSTVFLQDDQSIDWIIKAGFKSNERVKLEDIRIGTKIAVKGIARKPKDTKGGRTKSHTTMGLMHCTLICDGSSTVDCGLCSSPTEGCLAFSTDECTQAKSGCTKCTADKKCGKCDKAKQCCGKCDKAKAGCSKCTADKKCGKCADAKECCGKCDKAKAGCSKCTADKKCGKCAKAKQSCSVSVCSCSTEKPCPSAA